MPSHTTDQRTAPMATIKPARGGVGQSTAALSSASKMPQDFSLASLPRRIQSSLSVAAREARAEQQPRTLLA